MADQFHEEIVSPKNPKTVKTIKVLLTIVMAACVASVAIMMWRIVTPDGINWINIVNCVILLALAILCLYGRGQQLVEYEYAFTNGEVDIAKIVGSTKRKPLVSFKMQDVREMGRVNTGNFEDYDTDPDVKRTIAVLNKSSSGIIYVYFVKEGVPELVIMDPSKKLRSLMKQYDPNAGK